MAQVPVRRARLGELWRYSYPARQYPTRPLHNLSAHDDEGLAFHNAASVAFRIHESLRMQFAMVQYGIIMIHEARIAHRDVLKDPNEDMNSTLERFLDNLAAPHRFPAVHLLQTGKLRDCPPYLHRQWWTDPVEGEKSWPPPELGEPGFLKAGHWYMPLGDIKGIVEAMINMQSKEPSVVAAGTKSYHAIMFFVAIQIAHYFKHLFHGYIVRMGGEHVKCKDRSSGLHPRCGLEDLCKLYSSMMLWQKGVGKHKECAVFVELGKGMASYRVADEYMAAVVAGERLDEEIEYASDFVNCKGRDLLARGYVQFNGIEIEDADIRNELQRDFDNIHTYL